MKRLCVCGLGKVGRPLLDMFRGKGFSAHGYDINPELTELSLRGAVSGTDACLFIVPTPSLPSGAFSNEYLESALSAFREEAVRQEKTDYLYIVISTTVPGSCDQFRKIVGDNICYKPEFIRLEQVREDLLTPSFVMIGSSNKAAGDACQEIYSHVTDAPVKRMSLIEAELAKITLNCALTMKISLANQLHLVAERLGANSTVIMDAVGSDPRIGLPYLRPGAPYFGPCLPRDNRMFQYVAKSVGIRASLSRGADEINNLMIEG